MTVRFETAIAEIAEVAHDAQKALLLTNGGEVMPFLNFVFYNVQKKGISRSHNNITGWGLTLHGMQRMEFATNRFFVLSEKRFLSGIDNMGRSMLRSFVVPLRCYAERRLENTDCVCPSKTEWSVECAGGASRVGKCCAYVTSHDAANHLKMDGYTFEYSNGKSAGDCIGTNLPSTDSPPVLAVARTNELHGSTEIECNATLATSATIQRGQLAWLEDLVVLDIDLFTNAASAIEMSIAENVITQVLGWNASDF